MNKKNLAKELIIIFWIFIIGSILGYIFEMTIVLFQKGHFESRQGLIYGPLTPVYGIGGVIYYLILSNIKTKNKVTIFFITMILGGVTEYICSLVQEKMFGTISWDYSYLPFNLNGRTSLLHCTYWGIAGVLYSIYIEPLIEKIKEKTDTASLKTVTIALSIFIVFDTYISIVALDRKIERENEIVPEGRHDAILDKYYPDEFIDMIFANMREAH